MTRRVRITIGELSLRGFAPGDRAALAEGVRRELAERLAVPGALPAESRGIPRVDAGTVAPASAPGAAGARVAEAVVKGLAR